MSQIIFEDCSGYLLPRTPIDANGVLLEPDGKKFLTDLQAAQFMGSTVEYVHYLHEHAMSVQTPGGPTPAEMSDAASEGQRDRILRRRYRYIADEFYEQFLQQCHTSKVDPWSGGVYPEVSFDGRSGRLKLNMIVSIGVMRSIAAKERPVYVNQRGPYWLKPDGTWTDSWPTRDAPVAAKVGVVVQGDSDPLWSEAAWEEYAPFQENDNGEKQLVPLWADKGPWLLAVAAEAKSLRRAFGHLFGLLYTIEEMAQRNNRSRKAEISHPVERTMQPQIPALSVPLGRKPVVKMPESDGGIRYVQDEFSQV